MRFKSSSLVFVHGNAASDMVMILISGHSPGQAGSNRLFPWRNVSAFRLD
jgi:hypothetical protein